MTEQEIKQKINDCDWKIRSAYDNLRSAARDVGAMGYQAAQSDRSRAEFKASEDVLKAYLPFLITLVGFFMFGVSWVLALVMIIGGIVLTTNLCSKADDKQKEVKQKYNNFVSTAEYQQNILNEVLHNSTII